MQEKLPPLEDDPLDDLLGALKDLPELSEDLRLRLLAEGELKDLPLVTLGPLKDLLSLVEDPRKSISVRLPRVEPSLPALFPIVAFLPLKELTRPPLRSKIDAAPLLASEVLNPLLLEIFAVLKVSPVLLPLGLILKTCLLTGSVT